MGKLASKGYVLTVLALNEESIEKLTTGRRISVHGIDGVFFPSMTDSDLKKSKTVETVDHVKFIPKTRRVTSLIFLQ